MAELLWTSVSSLVEEKPFKTHEAIYDWEHMKAFVKTTDEDRDQVMKMYYDAIAENPKAALIKCIDRCNNLTTMSWGLSRERIYRMIQETEAYFPRLLRVIKAETEFNNAAWLLQYQMESMLDIYKRLL